jgi:type IV pilus assembly protein PilC
MTPDSTMTRFAYQARDTTGELIRGILEAQTISDVGRQLRAEGKFVVRIGPAPSEETEPGHVSLHERHRGVKRDDVIHFTHQLSVMIETGVTLGEALESIADQTANEHFRAVLEDVSQAVHAGQSFSSALGRHPKVFPVLLISLVQASEASGTMGQMLERVCTYLTKERHTARSVRGAMIYPVIMMIVAAAVTVFLLAFVLPRFSKIYISRGTMLPPPTQMLLWMSEMTTTYWYVWLSLAAAGIGAALWLRRTPGGRRALDWAKLHAPVLGPMMTQLYVTRAMRTMGTMIGAGVPMLDMIAITRNVTNNTYYEQLWDRVDEQLRQGSQLSQTLNQGTLIPPSIVRMIHSGEKAGRLGAVMERVADFTEHDFDESVKRTTELIEPILITVMGCIIGFVAISLLLPIFSVGRVMAGG